MKTDDLIQSLTGELKPVGRGAAAGRLAIGLGGGALVSTLVMLGWLGARPDLPQALQTPMFWVKFAYAALAALLLALATDRLSRPGARLGGLAVAVGLPFALMATMGAMRLAMAAREAWHELLMGDSADVCPWRILVIGLPLLAGAVWAVRGLAPTRLTLAGLMAGGAAGALATLIYSFHCPETAAPFVAVWYTLGMALVAALGAVTGARLLRWR
ncbi:MAG: NrsF family protein [Phenylobacterium sp.]